jgi:starch synthase
LNVLFASAEVSPLAKVGGLGDVAGSLPIALRDLGVDVRVAMPLYGSIDRDKYGLRRIIEGVQVPWQDFQTANIYESDVRGVPVYLVQHAGMFERPNVYGYQDDRDRFLFFCQAILAAAPQLGFTPDVVHAQDWHSAWLLTRLAGAAIHPWSRAGRVYTIHNLALQGNFERSWATWHRIHDQLLDAPEGLPGDITLSGMAQGILHADRVNTVSDTYAQEILTPEYGAGLDPLLRARGDRVSGIVNGIDYEEFNPETDAALAVNYGADTVTAREEDKRALQREAGLPEDGDALLFGVVTRLFAQKGIDLLGDAFDGLLRQHNIQLAVLGTGDEAVHEMLLRLESAHPGKVKIWLEFNPQLGQRIYGGCDCFLMPSRYEPCGLGQLISLRYGAVPLVRRTGGLNDTVEDVRDGTGTGFVFEAATAHDLSGAAERAIAAYADRAAWRAIQQRGMRQDWSWGRAALKYRDLYEAAAADRAGGSK